MKSGYTKEYSKFHGLRPSEEEILSKVGHEKVFLHFIKIRNTSYFCQSKNNLKKTRNHIKEAILAKKHMAVEETNKKRRILKRICHSDR